MDATWKHLHVSLLRWSQTPEAGRAFARARVEQRALGRFSDAGAVVAFFTRTHGRVADKDQCLAVLVGMVQRRREITLATTLLWLALWPGLDGIYARHRRRAASEEELVSAISEAFLALVAGLDLTVVTKIAATLVWSTDRDLVQEEMRSRFRAELQAEKEGDAQSPKGQDPEGAILSFEYQVLAARGWLGPVAGRDTDLVLDVVVFDQSQREVSERLGLSHEVVRKRVQRALIRAREFLSGVSISVSPIETADALPPMSGECSADGADR